MANDTRNISVDLSLLNDVGVSTTNFYDDFLLSIVINHIFFLKIPLDLSGIPPITVDDDTLVLIIEQLLMLILIIGRWMLPKVIFYGSL